jgi:hypothetical protein
LHTVLREDRPSRSYRQAEPAWKARTGRLETVPT